MDDIKEDISLKNRKKLPEELKSKRNNMIFKNLLIAICITVYFILINLGYYNIEKNIYMTDLKIFSIIVLAISIILFEKGYRKDNEGIFLSGIEVLIIAIITLAEQYRIFYSFDNIQMLFNLVPVYFIIYYTIKLLINTRMIEKEYSATDVREIVKKGEVKW